MKGSHGLKDFSLSVDGRVLLRRFACAQGTLAGQGVVVACVCNVMQRGIAWLSRMMLYLLNSQDVNAGSPEYLCVCVCVCAPCWLHSRTRRF